MLKITPISPRDLGEYIRRRRRSFIYHKFIHTHNLPHYYKVGDQASVEVQGAEEQMLIFSLSLAPGRVKGSWIVLISNLKDSCVLNLVWPLSSNRAVAHDARSQRGIWCHRTSASTCFFGNDRSSRSRVRTRLITKCVYYEWASDSFAYPCPYNNSWYARAYPRVKKRRAWQFVHEFVLADLCNDLSIAPD